MTKQQQRQQETQTRIAASLARARVTATEKLVEREGGKEAMAEIRSFWFVRHLRAEPTTHVILFKNGHKVLSGRGVAFWFMPLGASIAEVPLDDRELPFLFSGRSSDFQDVAV